MWRSDASKQVVPPPAMILPLVLGIREARLELLSSPNAAAAAAVVVVIVLAPTMGMGGDTGRVLMSRVPLAEVAAAAAMRSLAEVADKKWDIFCTHSDVGPGAGGCRGDGASDVTLEQMAPTTDSVLLPPLFGLLRADVDIDVDANVNVKVDAASDANVTDGYDADTMTGCHLFLLT